MKYRLTQQIEFNFHDVEIVGTRPQLSRPLWNKISFYLWDSFFPWHRRLRQNIYRKMGVNPVI